MKKIKTARGRKLSSILWLERQLNDPYVKAAHQAGYRSRSAYKLLEIDDQCKIIPKGGIVIDLGAAPGGWIQAALERGAAHVIGIDLLPIDTLDKASLLQMDFMDDNAPQRLIDLAGGPVDAVFSDIAPNTSGHKNTDHIRIIALVEAAYDFARTVLKKDGHFIAKVFQGGTENTLLARMKKEFRSVRHIKPAASRKDSSEIYVVCTYFHGIPQTRPTPGTDPGDHA